jgi:hypothetical protein
MELIDSLSSALLVLSMQHVSIHTYCCPFRLQPVDIVVLEEVGGAVKEPHGEEGKDLKSPRIPLTYREMASIDVRTARVYWAFGLRGGERLRVYVHSRI